MNVHDQVMRSMREMAEKFARHGIQLQLPPASNSTMGTRYIEIDLGKMLAAEFRFDPKFANPMQVVQGGLLCAMFDEVYGPLSYGGWKASGDGRNEHYVPSPVHIARRVHRRARGSRCAQQNAACA
jgi:hypothetical protein